jgi:hypothetical protein
MNICTAVSSRLKRIIIHKESASPLNLTCSVGQIEVIVRKGSHPSMTNSIQLSLIKDMSTDYYPSNPYIETVLLTQNVSIDDSLVSDVDISAIDWHEEQNADPDIRRVVNVENK